MNGAWNDRRPVRVKLVRDRIDTVAELEGEYSLRPANTHAGRVQLLQSKLHEEAAEIAESPTDASEYADLVEVMLCLAAAEGVTWDQIEEAIRDKRERLGSFRRGMVLTRVQE